MRFGYFDDSSSQEDTEDLQDCGHDQEFKAYKEKTGWTPQQESLVSDSDDLFDRLLGYKQYYTDEYGQDYKKVAAEFVMKDKKLPTLDFADGEPVLDVQTVHDSLLYTAREMQESNDADTIIDNCAEQWHNIADTILTLKRMVFEWNSWSDDITACGMREHDLQHCTTTMYSAVTAFRLADERIKNLQDYIKPTNFDDPLDFADYDEELYHLEQSREKVATAICDPLIWDHFVPWDIYKEAYSRDQEDMPIQERIQTYCIVYGGSTIDALDHGHSEIPAEWKGEARMRVGNAATH